ncbi:MAG: hypothetical protein PHY43_00440 [Verrucomicrobiales bacterium]|nr:hypothetical protein [Verrucomicrobiales bacterium]
MQTIRTLMERSALYRRALAPIMIWAGLVGIAAAAAGCWLKIESGAGFIAYWLTVALAGVAGAFLLVRRQALQSTEPFWSPPTRRVAQAVFPALSAGFLLGILCLFVWSEAPVADPPTGMSDNAGELFWLPAIWALFYGCAIHAAGFFTLRGLRLLGGLFILSGIAVLAWVIFSHHQDFPMAAWQASHWLMGSLFGFLQLAYGAYLYLTEQKNPVA